MPRLLALCLVLSVLAVCEPGTLSARPRPKPAQRPMTGTIEQRFLAVPSAAGALETSRAADARAHYPGTPGDYAFARYMRDELREAGFTATIESFRGPIDRPRRLALSIIDDLGRSVRSFDLREGPVPGDPEGRRGDAGIPFNYGSGSADLRAPMVPVGRGLDADYAALAAAHTSVRGRIAIVRYGAEFRGLLAARAQHYGAAGVIFYSSPRDDATRPETSAQRGTVSDGVLRIPTLPVTLRTARSLLDAAAHGKRAELFVRIERHTGTMWNTIGVLRGRTGDEIVLGGHRDAWVYGVTDNGSGIATLLEIARAFGTVARRGWRPARTIVIAGFDAEEIGELGSRAFVRTHRADLERNAMAYLNADEVVTGPKFQDDAAGALSGIVTRAARDLHVANVPNDVRVPGGGSDHESFLFAPGPGIATAQVGFGGRLGTYHSAYDDLYFARAHDPGFAFHREVARVLGLVALRLSEIPRPFRFRPYVEQLRDAQAKLLTDRKVVAIGGADPDVFGPLDAAIAHFSVASSDVDAAPAKRPTYALTAATRALDRALYGATGYGEVTFPGIRAALANGNATAVRKAAAAASKAIDEAADLISPSSS